MSNPNLTLNPLPAEEEALLKRTEKLQEVINFFLYAPPTCIRDLRNELLKQGFELQYGFADTYHIQPAE